jgi:hypothetical protein
VVVASLSKVKRYTKKQLRARVALQGQAARQRSANRRRTMQRRPPQW